MTIIIEFAKLLPNFTTQIEQQDQIHILKNGAFELALLITASNYDLHTDRITVNDVSIPLSSFECLDESESILGHSITNNIRELAMFSLSTSEKALLAATIIMEPAACQQKLVEKIRMHLKQQLISRPADDEANTDLYGRLFNFVEHLGESRNLHLKCLKRFRSEMPEVVAQMPPLYRELFLGL